MTKISIYKNVLDNKGSSIDLFEALEAIKTGGLGLAEHQAKVRAAIGDEQKRLKEKTLAITPSGEFSGRVDSKLIQHTGFLNFDIDKIEDLPAVYEIVANDKHCFAIWLSISGKGISGLFKVPEGLDKDSHIEAYKDMMAYFSEFHGIDVDESCQNVSRLRFLSHDENLTIDKNAKVFTWKRPKEKPQKAIPRRMTARMLGGANYITEYNEKTPCLGLLESYGWTFLYSKGGKDRMTRPNGSKGQNHGEVFSDNRFQSYTNFERIGSKPDKPSSPFDIFCHYEHGGDEESAKNAIRPFELGANTRTGAFQDDVPLPMAESEFATFSTQPIEIEDRKPVQKPSIKVKTAEDVEVQLPTFPVHTLPQKYQSIIASVSAALDVPPDLLGVSMMMASSVAVGFSVVLKLANGWQNSCALFTALVGDSASGKSPALDFAFDTLRQMDTELIRNFKEQNEAYEEAQMEKETRGTIPKPIKRELILEDSTIESVMNSLEANPHGVGLVADELSGFINSMNQYQKGKGGEQKKWLSIYDHISFKKSTVSRGSQAVENPYVPITGGIQPSVIHELAKDGKASDGFMFRFIFCIAEERSPMDWDSLVENALPSATKRAWEIVIENLLTVREYANYAKNEHEQRNETKGDKWIGIKLSNDSEGGKLWGNWYNANNAEIKAAQLANDPQKVSILTKISKICSRLILLNQMMMIGSEINTEMPEEICTQAVKSAIAQAAYFKTTTFYVFSIIQEEEAENRHFHRDTKCDWLEIFTTQEEVTEGLTSSEIANRILTKHGKTSKTARAWIKNDLAIAPNLPTDDKRTKRYTI